MKTARVFFCVLLLAISAGSAVADVDPADYPLHFRVIRRNQHWFRGYFDAHGWADLTDGDNTQGVIYSVSCTVAFDPNFQDDYYNARWKKPGEELEVINNRLGSDKEQKCTFRVEVKDYVFWHGGPGVGMITMSQEQWQKWRAEHPHKQF